MAKVPAPKKVAKKVAKAPAKKVAAPKRITTGDKKKKDFLPGTSPWERKAIKSGQYGMTEHQIKMHKAFVQGKKEGWSAFKNGTRENVPLSRMKVNQLSTSKKNEGSMRAVDGAKTLGYQIALTNKTKNAGNGTSGSGINYWKTLKKNSKNTIAQNKTKVYYKKGK